MQPRTTWEMNFNVVLSTSGWLTVGCLWQIALIYFIDLGNPNLEADGAIPQFEALDWRER